MILERGLNAVIRRAGSIVTVGTFDGVHLGHRMIIADLVRRAKNSDGLSTLITFDPHPREVLQNQPLPKLTTMDERAAILSSLGLGRLVILPFSDEFSKLSAERFVTDLLMRSIGIRTIVVGHDHRFGMNRKGDVNLLSSMGGQYGFDVGVVEPYFVDHEVVSSRKIRSILQEEGNVSFASTLLSRPYSITGYVIHGDSRGRELGYPTANLVLADPNKVIPLNGIYAVRVQMGGTLHGGIMSIGIRPAIKDSQGLHLEVHILDFDDDIYEKKLTVHFYDRIRDEKNFDTMQQLQVAMQQDELECRKILEPGES